MNPNELGSARQTRHSFSRAFLRTAVQQGWKFSKRKWELDSRGCGRAIYEANLAGHKINAVVFSHVIDEELRTDRVIAQDWDVTFALVDGEVSEADLESLSQQVTVQEDGRADSRTLIWARANRSQRFFDYVVDCLANGNQPDPSQVSDAAYIMRSTAFYGNGKWGLRDFDGIGAEHPLGVPYRAQMLAAWLLREFSADLAEHCARAKAQSASMTAVPLDIKWRRFLGLGNATGLGMVPYVIRHPQVLDAWVALRELPLANARSQNWKADSLEWAKVVELLMRAKSYFIQKVSFQTAPYPSGPELADQLEIALGWATEYQQTSTINGKNTDLPGHEIHLQAQGISVELRQIVDSVLIECDSSFDSELENLLLCEDRTALNPTMSIQELDALLEKNYGWVAEHDFNRKGSSAMFWFYSRNNQEPRRGVRGKDPGVITEHPVGVARDVAELWKDMRKVSTDQSVGTFLLDYPQHWGIIERVQSVHHLPYSEARINPLSDTFLPLDLQRFQLALYGMENFNPQSTDWLRVTLYGGAPTVSDVNAAEDVDDWLFAPRPEVHP
jgi:hypothetical protein